MRLMEGAGLKEPKRLRLMEDAGRKELDARIKSVRAGLKEQLRNQQAAVGQKEQLRR